MIEDDRTLFDKIELYLRISNWKSTFIMIGYKKNIIPQIVIHFQQKAPLSNFINIENGYLVLLRIITRMTKLETKTICS